MTGPMKTILVISSFVAASRVGATASAFCLRRLGHDVVVLPTTLMGRHPGWGKPGGGAVPAARMTKMWEAIKAQDIHFDAILTGYMGEIEHISLAADIIQSLKTANPALTVLVDPVMGDEGRLYIPEARALAICKQLIPLASVITPNVWELSYMTNAAGMDARCETLVTSVAINDQIGAEYTSHSSTSVVSHKKFDSVPHGGGDALAGLFLGHHLNDHDPIISMSKAVAGVFKMMTAANELDAGELPLIRTQNEWADPLPLTAKTIQHD